MYYVLQMSFWKHNASWVCTLGDVAGMLQWRYPGHLKQQHQFITRPVNDLDGFLRWLIFLIYLIVQSQVVLVVQTQLHWNCG